MTANRAEEIRALCDDARKSAALVNDDDARNAIEALAEAIEMMVANEATAPKGAEGVGTMRTQEEIVAKCNAEKGGFLGFALDVLIQYLDFEHAKAFLKPEATAEEWAASGMPQKASSIEPKMRDYMAFAWDKALDHRGISASRSVDKIGAWVWLMGRDDVSAAMEGAGYENYGVPKLHVACEMLGLPIPVGDEINRMRRGESCVPGCDAGCGS